MNCMHHDIRRMMLSQNFKKFVDKQMLSIGKKYGMKNMELYIFMYISRNPEENTGKDIQKNLNINKGYLSQMLDSLCTKGYFKAETDKNDRRYVHYSLTEASDEIVKELLELRQNLDAQIFKGISEEEFVMMLSVMEKIHNNMKEFLEENK